MAASFTALPIATFAQTSIPEDTLDVLPSQTGAAELGLRSGSVVAAPIPFSNPTVGTGLALGGAWLFEADPDSSTSSIGLGGFRSSNGSEGFVSAINYNWNANRHQVALAFGHANINYDFTGTPIEIGVEQAARLVRMDYMYGATADLSIGFGMTYSDTRLAFSSVGDFEVPDELRAVADLEAIRYGLMFDWDTRDDEFSPTTGTHVTFDAFYGDVVGLASRDYAKATLLVDSFIPVFSGQGVFGSRLALCAASEDAPFFDACSIGLTDSFRGFSVTDFIDTRLVSAQFEYRGRIGAGRLGHTAFLGVGVVEDETHSLFSGDLHAAGGVGLRYRISRDFPVDFSIDVTLNDDGERLLYVFVGQSF